MKVLSHIESESIMMTGCYGAMAIIRLHKDSEVFFSVSNCSNV